MEGILKREFVLDKTLSRSILIFSFATAITLGAHARIPLPFTPVPLTLQTFFILLSAALLGARMGMAAQALYMCAGISGLGVFTGAGSGLSYFQGVTGGYLVGFSAALAIVSLLAPRTGNKVYRVVGVFLLADFLILACGTLWLKVVCGYNGAQAMLCGFWPFVPGDALKAVLAAWVYIKTTSRIKEIIS
ncbi:MAG: biotin transporter BioY [Candidatus Omnitrophota bacterium]